MYPNARVEIVEEPSANTVRFRYSRENQLRASIVGVKNTTILKSYPSIKVVDYTGNAIAIVSCVTVEHPCKPHPHNLIGNNCRKGVCRYDFVTDSSAPTIVTFENIGIECGKKSELEANLNLREVLRIDPFKTGFQHKADPKSIDFTKFRLCFQILLRPDPGSLKLLIPILPIVSLPIHDKKNTLQVQDISDKSSPTCGGRKIIILCEKVLKNDIKVRFFEETTEGREIWEGWGVFNASKVHQQFAITFTTPQYKTLDIDEPVNVFVQLFRPSDNAKSLPTSFQYVPDVNNIHLAIKAKKRKIDESNAFFEFLRVFNDQTYQQVTNVNLNISASAGKVVTLDTYNVNMTSNNLFHSQQPEPEPEPNYHTRGYQQQPEQYQKQEHYQQLGHFEQAGQCQQPRHHIQPAHYQQQNTNLVYETQSICQQQHSNYKSNLSSYDPLQYYHETAKQHYGSVPTNTNLNQISNDIDLAQTFYGMQSQHQSENDTNFCRNR